MKVKKQTISGKSVALRNIFEKKDPSDTSLELLLKTNRNILPENEHLFFEPTLADLHDPFLMPGMENAVERISAAITSKERIVIFGDYDVDGVSSTALLVKFLTEEFQAHVSYRLPHRVNDGYGLKSYFFDDLAEKSVKLVITVDCGTRDIEPIRYAKQLGIDVIVTDHHAVPEEIPKEVIAILNPKRRDSEYPFTGLSGSGVALKLAHAMLIHAYGNDQKKIESSLEKYIDFSALGTVSDCMPLIDENRIITKFWLRQMKKSTSSGLRQFVESSQEEIEDNAEFIWFRIGPRINASGRMDTPLTALRWLLASDARASDFLEEIEMLNTKRQAVVKDFTEKALLSVNGNDPILFFVDPELEHGLIGLVAGKLTETYNRPSIVLCKNHIPAEGETKKREYEHQENANTQLKTSYVASCRAPEWCDIMFLLDQCQDLFLRYGGHRQAAGFSIIEENYPILQERLEKYFRETYDATSLPSKTIHIEGTITPHDINIETLNTIDRFRPFWIGNPAPIWLLENVTILSVRKIGKDQNHMMISLKEAPEIKFLFWNAEKYEDSLSPGNIISPIIRLEKNVWNNQISVQGIIEDIIDS